MISIPQAFSKVIIQMHGQKGRAWLGSLGGKIALSKERWGLEVFPPFELSYNYVAPVVFKDGGEAVLKICIPGKECQNEIHALKFYAGLGICSLIDCDSDQGILLLERLKPGNKLTSINDEPMTVTIAASLIKTIKTRKALPLYSFPAVSDLALGIKNLRRYYHGGAGPFRESIVQKVESLFPELISSQRDTYLLHGDFHHENILHSNGNWKLIDPKGVVGEMEYELIPFLINNLPKRGAGDVIDSRVILFQKELDINVDRTYAWGLCHSLLSAWWNIEDNLGLSDRELPILRYFSEKID